MGLGLEVAYWIVVFVTTAILLFIDIYSLILFSDLLLDHLNPIELCEKVNFLIYPEFGVHVFLTLFLFFGGHWFVAVFNLPLVAFHVRKYLRNEHLLDNTRVFRVAAQVQRYYELKMGFFLVTFVTYLYCFIRAMLTAKS
ncbi:hypothetical protein GAYE_PCTG70G1497 [Galdieria yellowstonensis]|uniref:Cornichon n=1 Tax=Galdieria yellowstonensis TaxID=3028027 RepID=A0AAV9I8H6_9RHOD|nr:hypothetical protein GAYE_PCTG70G1497 [Galdieria yellowstonensis]